MMLQSICKHLLNYGGSMLIGDYGHWGTRGDTFRVSSSIKYYLFNDNICSIGFP